MCGCVDVEVGSYGNQVLLQAPAHMPKENGYCVDRCLASEVQALWALGVVTTGCCCGHNRVAPFIGVAPSDIERMKAMGYEVVRNATRPGDEDSFSPKSLTL